MSSEPDYDACAVCGRRLLAGERPTTYVTRDWEEALVCELCKPRAEAAGWMRPEEAEAARAGGAGRERRRPRGQMLSGLLSRFPAQQGEGVAAGAEAPVEQASRRTLPQAPQPPAEPSLADVELTEALRNFNFSDHRRTVAGLTRTLGPPRATGLPIAVSGGIPGFRITVAWELTWYQWEIAASERGVEVRESGKGETISQLGRDDRAWNLIAGSDGTLQQRVGTGASEGD